MESLLDMLRTFGTEILARPEGPFAFRFILQPLMSLLMATRDGIISISRNLATCRIIPMLSFFMFS